MKPILHHDRLERPTASLTAFSDVFPKNERDFDAELTSQYRHLGVDPSGFDAYGIGHNPQEALYASVLIDDLVAERRRLIIQALEGSAKPHPDVLKAQDKAANFSPQVILNCAPRSKETTENGANGTDFYLAITDNGVEIYATPVELLSALETRNRIIGLYQIPTAELPFTDGSKEQFRSSIVGNVRLRPQVLQPVYEYKDRAQLIAAKAAGAHSEIIPTQGPLAQIAFVDKFGNVRLSVRDSEAFRQQLEQVQSQDGAVRLEVEAGASQPVRLVQSLRELEDFELGLYENVADHPDPHSKAAYWELVRRLPDPNQGGGNHSAADLLGARNPSSWRQEFRFTAPE
jgi:hypothetical protein